MPYSGISDSKLPEAVQKLPKHQREIWVAAWNSSFAACQKESGDDCEGRAFRIANAAVAKEKEKKADLFQATGEHTGLLVAVWLDEALANALAIPGGESPNQLHITLCYCGDANEMSDVQIGRAIGAVAETSMMFGPLTGQIAGIGRFNASESSDGLDVFYANVDVPGLAEMRQSLAASLEYMANCPPRADHGYTPHITLSYISPNAPFPFNRIESQPIAIRSLWLSIGDKRTEIPLSGTYSAFKAGARHSKRDQQMLQTMHDHAVTLGASCGGKAIPEPVAMKAVPVEGNALKAVGKTDDELRVANYMVLFNGRDLEGLASPRRNPDGSKGEFFTKSTKFDSPYTDLGFLYVDWEHGMAPDDEPGRDEPLGYVDWKTAKIDDKGLFVERVLNRRNRYIKFVEDLFEQGVFGASSEAISEQVQRKANGEIEIWPLRRDTLTVNPMDYRQLSENTLARIKALSERIPALKSIANQAEQLATPEVSQPEAGRTPAALDTDSSGKAIDASVLLLELELLQLGA